MGYSHEVVRTELGTTRFTNLIDPDSVTLAPGEALISVDRFALTANNITYGVAGDIIGYWQFFPAEDEWGRIPVWGKGTVVDAGNTGLTNGAEYYGYFPMSSYLIVRPANVSERGFVDGAAHRAELPPVYNQYSLMTPENGFDRAKDNHRMVLYPLFITGFVLDDYLADNDDFGAEDVILSSASSKTSFSMAFMLHQRGNRRVIGLTSASNKAFVENMGIYDLVVAYDDIESLDNSKTAAFVDMAGNADVRTSIHNHYAGNLVCSSGVGMTHWDAETAEAPSSLPGAKPSMFFAPTQIQKRNKEWGPEEFGQKMSDAWERFLGEVDQWITINEAVGQAAMEETFQTVLKGAKPDQAYVVVVN